MSRSYKHTPRSGQKKNKFAKRHANRTLRREKLAENVPQHGGYRKRTERWDICDYETVGESFERYYESAVFFWSCRSRFRHREEPFPEREQVKKEYNKRYIRK